MIEKHYPGQHDQLDHGNWAGASASDDLRNAIVRWKGNPASIRQDMRHVLGGARIDGVGTTQAQALIDAFGKATPSTIPLYRGDADIRGLQPVVGDTFQLDFIGTTPNLRKAVAHAMTSIEVKVGRRSIKGVPGIVLEIEPGAFTLPIDRIGEEEAIFADEDEHLVSGLFEVTGVERYMDHVRAKVRQVEHFLKHYGPGPHPGTMTEQSVHGEQGGELEFDLSQVNQMRASLLTGSTAPFEVQSWARQHIERFRPVLFGLDASDLDARSRRQYQSRLGSFIQRLTNLYYQAQNVEFAKRKTNRSPAFPHGPSIKWPRVYEALRRQGMSKEQAAAISNAHWNRYRRWGRAGRPGPRSEEEYRSTRGRKPRKHQGIPLPKSRQVKKIATPDDVLRLLYARSLVAKHRPGGVDHDQSTHGNWSSGSGQDMSAMDALRPENLQRASSRLYNEYLANKTGGVNGSIVSVWVYDDTRFGLVVEQSGRITLTRYLSNGGSMTTYGDGGEGGVQTLLDYLEGPGTRGNLDTLQSLPEPEPVQQELFDTEKIPRGKGGKKIVSSQSSRKKTFELTDPTPISDLTPDSEADEIGKAIFDADIQIGDETFYSRTNSADGDSSFLEVSGEILSPEGYTAATWRREVNFEAGTVYNSSLFIDPEYQGRGLGTALLSHWEDELVAMGITEMNLGTAEVGSYAWAMAGYEWDDPQMHMEMLNSIVAEDGSFEENYGDYWQPTGNYGTEEWEGIKAEAAELLERHGDGDFISISEVAALGMSYRDPDEDMHFGKDFLLHGPSWDGTKQIG